MESLTSVLTQTFNQGKYIGTCIQSLLNQTDPHWEMIIMDDGSTDETPDIVAEYQDPRIRYLRMEHQGIDHLGKIYNRALQESRGELILILEGDDYIPAYRLELQKSAFRDDRVVLSHGRYAYVFDDRVVVYPNPFKMSELRNRPIGSALKIFLQGFNPIGSQSVMIRKSALLDIGGFVQPSYLPLVDYPTWMRLALMGTFEFIPEVLGFWRRHPQSVTMKKNEQIFEGFIRYGDDFVASFREEMSLLGLEEFFCERGAIAYLSLAWIKLSNGDWNKALELSKRSWALKGNVSRSFKFKMIIGLIGALLHIDLPSCFKSMKLWFYQR